jgi:DNA-binding response OmpR family regulator
MRIAIIEDDEILIEKLSKILKKDSWVIEFFKGSADFGQTNIGLYDVIISDESLKPIDGRELLTILSKKTSAELLLMNDSFKKEDLENRAIKGLIDKSNLMNVFDKLEYLDTKLRIQNLASVQLTSLNKT